MIMTRKFGRFYSEIVFKIKFMIEWYTFLEFLKSLSDVSEFYVKSYRSFCVVFVFFLVQVKHMTLFGNRINSNRNPKVFSSDAM